MQYYASEDRCLSGLPKTRKRKPYRNRATCQFPLQQVHCGVTESLSSIAETLRTRLVRGVEAGTLVAGDRLPSARELVTEFRVDNRTILAAYRQLADDGLVEIRERGGVYVSESLGSAPNLSMFPAKWFSELFTEALARGIAAPVFVDNLRRSLETLRLRAVVLSSTQDQVAGLARELRDDFGFVADGIVADKLASVAPDVLRRADLFLATEGHAALVEKLGSQYSKPTIILTVRSDFVAGEWALLLRQPIWAIVATKEFGAMLKHFLGGLRGIENLHVMVHGVDDLTLIPAGAPIYVTHRVRDVLDIHSLPGRFLPPARTISTESAREIFSFLVPSNVAALQAILGAGNGVDGQDRR